MGDSKCSPNRDPRLRSSSATTWDNQVPQNNQFNNSQVPVHTAYQHLHSNNMYNNANQYVNQQYYSGYENYNYNSYQYNQAGQGYMGGETQSAAENYTGTGGWTSTYNQPPAPPPASGTNFNYSTEKTSKSEAVAQELVKQKENLLKERETYKERVLDLGKKLKMLIEQKEQLTSKRSPDRDTLYIIEENTKLQLEIQNKIKDANNVIDILSGSIGDGGKTYESDGLIKDVKNEKINYKHYDPEIHWCRMCDVFPESARKLLIHLHSKGHQEIVQEESPWHKLPAEPKFPVFDGAPIRRLPIKGLQFFVASTAWYCRLCDLWIGDLHCASEHLMSITHTQNYSNFVEQNPHWEIEWLKDREKALERIKRKEKQHDSDSDDKKRRRKKDKYSSSGRDKKKKKRSKRRRKHSSDSSSSSSSSSSSDEEEDEDKSKSIHVAMRNKIKMFSNSDDKLEILDKLLQERQVNTNANATANANANVNEDKLMSQWMTVSEPPDKDKKLLESLKEKLKQKQDAEKAKVAAEYEAMKRIKEKEEYDKKQAEKAKAEAKHREEEEMKKREKMSLKLKEQSNKVKSKRSYRSPSRSPSRDKHSRSISPEKKYNRRSSHRRSYEDSHRYDDKDKKDNYKKFGFIGKMPLFKNQRVKKPESDRKEKEIQREDYDTPRKTRFQPGNLARAFIPEPEVVMFPKLSSYPPLAPPPPPAIKTEIPPAPPNISVPAPPPPPKIEQPKSVPKEEEKIEEVPEQKEPPQSEPEEESKDDYEMLYEEYGSTSDYNQLYQHQQPHSYDFMQVPNENDPENVPRSHTMPLQPPPLPPDDPNDLAMLGISSDDMAVQQMY